MHVCVRLQCNFSSDGHRAECQLRSLTSGLFQYFALSRLLNVNYVFTLPENVRQYLLLRI